MTLPQAGREVYRLMGRVLGLALCENIPLGIPLASSFFKLLASGSLFPEPPTLVSVKGGL